VTTPPGDSLGLQRTLPVTYVPLSVCGRYFQRNQGSLEEEDMKARRLFTAALTIALFLIGSGAAEAAVRLRPNW